MDMAAKYQDQTIFHHTGKRTGEGLAEPGPGLRSALLAAYRDLTRLRYDYPVVLRDPVGAGHFVVSLSAVMAELIAALAPRGIEGERVRRQLLGQEQALRALVAEGAAGTLRQLWPLAAERAAAGDAEALDLLLRAADGLGHDGQLADCDSALAARLIERAWRQVQAQRSAMARAQIDRLVRQLDDILRAAHAHSVAGQQPEALRAGFGVLHAETFDFAAMSRLVVRNVPQDELPATRRARIERTLAVLRAQTFHPDPRSGEPVADGFQFTSCAAAMAAHQARLPALADLVRAIAVAELEARGAYVEAEHDAYFAACDESLLGVDDLALLPDSLVCIEPEHSAAPENAALLEMLSSGLPAKVLVQPTELLDDGAPGQGHYAFGVRGARLATTAMGLGGMFVLQSVSANLYALRERVRHGMERRSPALFCVFPGTPPGASTLPDYLTAAAAMKSRLFPAFTYDALAGQTQAARFSLENNRHPEQDWPLETLKFADEDLQRVQLPVHFTTADYALCDRRQAAHFAVVPRSRWSAAMLRLDEWLQLPESQAADRVPYVWAADEADGLHRVLVDARLAQATRRCLLLWHRLQESGGVHNSYAERAVEAERAALAAQQAAESPAIAQADAPEAAPSKPPSAATPSPAPMATPEGAARDPDQPWIETARCSTCNECQNINNRLFAYNDNQQAYIKDLSAGSYRQMVEAAEACQVAVIHPGKPWNPSEPGLAELIERARPFQ
jgi:ferredoxin